MQGGESVGLDERCAGSDGEGIEIAADEFGGGAVVFDEDSFGRAAAKGFDAHGTRAGEEVEKTRARYVRAENVKEGFAQAIAGGTEGVTFERFEEP